MDSPILPAHQPYVDTAPPPVDPVGGAAASAHRTRISIDDMTFVSVADMAVDSNGGRESEHFVFKVSNAFFLWVSRLWWGTHGFAMSAGRWGLKFVDDSVKGLAVSNPEISDGLAPDETSLFYQKTTFPKGFVSGCSEILVTRYRVVLTQTDHLWNPIGVPVRQRQQFLDRRYVRGYSASLVVPSCRPLLWAILYLFIGWTLLDGWLLLEFPGLLLSTRVPVLKPLLDFVGGPCADVHRGLCGNLTFGEALAIFENDLGIRQSPKFLAGTHQETHSQPQALLEKFHFHDAIRQKLIPKKHAILTAYDNHVSKLQSPSGDVKVVASVREQSTKTHCEDFPGWQDSEGEGCQTYAAETGPLSCTKNVLLGENRRSNRKDSTALGLTADEACCACRGGSKHARSKAITKLQDLLMPLVIEHSDIAPHVTSISFETALHTLPSHLLWEWGRMLGTLPITEIVEQNMEAPQEILTILQQIERASVGLVGRWMLLKATIFGVGSFSIKQDEKTGHLFLYLGSLLGGLFPSEGWAVAEFPDGVVRLKVQNDVLTANVKANVKGSSTTDWGEDLVAWRTMRKESLFSPDVFIANAMPGAIGMFKPILLKAYAVGVTAGVVFRCLFRILAYLVILNASLTIILWMRTRFVYSRIYVTLKVHRDYFSTHDREKSILWQPWLDKHKIETVYSFYLPSPSTCPGRLPAFALALLETEEAPSWQQRHDRQPPLELTSA